MRIAVVLGGFPNLSETFILDQITGLIDRGHDVSIFGYPPSGGTPVHEAVESYRLLDRTHHYLRGWSTPVDLATRTWRRFRREPVRTVAMLARSLDLHAARDWLIALGSWPLASSMLQCAADRGAGFDVVLAHFGTNAVLAERVRELGAFRAPIVATFLGKDLSHHVKHKGARYYDSLFRRGETMLSVSDHYRSRLIELGCPANRVRVHRLGVDTKSFRPSARTLADGEHVRFLSVCRFVEKKGLEHGMRAMARLAAERVAFEWHLAGDGPLRDALEGQARALGLTERVVFHGAVRRSRALELFASSHVFVAPSVTARDGDQEGIPVAIVEAMACGMPIVSTRHSGIPEIVADGETGYLVPEKDDEALANALERAVREHARWPDLGRRGRAVVEAEYDIERLNDTLANLLSEVARTSGYARSRVGVEASRTADTGVETPRAADTGGDRIATLDPAGRPS